MTDISLKTKIKIISPMILGSSKEDAIYTCKEMGMNPRITKEDGKAMIYPRVLVADLVRLEVVKGIVTKVS